MPSSINKPVIIVGCPRSGTTLLYTILSESNELYSLYNESRFVFRKLYLEKLKQGVSFASDLLRVQDLDGAEMEFLREEFSKYAFNSKLLGKSIHKLWRRSILLKPVEYILLALNQLFKPKTHRFVEKTPRNCFKVELMNELFPDAYFVFIKRDPRTNISSLIEAWRARESSTGQAKRLPALRYELEIEGYEGKDWRFALPPGWEEYRSKSLEEVCAYQWLKSNQEALAGLENIPASRKIEISYEDLIDNPSQVIESICNFANLGFNPKMQKLAANPPQVNYLGDKPDKDKWKKNEALIERVTPMIDNMASELGYDLKIATI